ncbi:MAG: 23S rRNA (adenine(2503)-C(2))-methyltransferase RlmN [Paracoccaceae bacterium]
MTFKSNITNQTIKFQRMIQLNSQKTDLVGLKKNEISNLINPICGNNSCVNMRVSQLWDWIYTKGETDFTKMTNMSKKFRDTLNEKFYIGRPEIQTKLISQDGTRKYLLKLRDNNLVETVFIPDKDRGTLCISSQVGCTLNCSFCFTGTQGLVRNLSASEIVQQLMVARDDLLEWDQLKDSKVRKRSISNIVLMGMGEPLYNFEEVKSGLKIIMDETGISISRKRITLSTSGVVPKIASVGEEIGCLLAISFHATTDEVRNRLVPLNRKWNIKSLLDSLRNYPSLSNSERITFEYVMIDNVNDSKEDAKRLVKLISGIPSKINLIPFNPWPGSEFKTSTSERIRDFSKIINAAGYSSPIRTPRGQDIMAACGQLKSVSKKIKKSQLHA